MKCIIKTMLLWSLVLLGFVLLMVLTSASTTNPSVAKNYLDYFQLDTNFHYYRPVPYVLSSTGSLGYKTNLYLQNPYYDISVYGNNNFSAPWMVIKLKNKFFGYDATNIVIHVDKQPTVVQTNNKWVVIFKD